MMMSDSVNLVHTVLQLSDGYNIYWVINPSNSLASSLINIVIYLDDLLELCVIIFRIQYAAKIKQGFYPRCSLLSMG